MTTLGNILTAVPTDLWTTFGAKMLLADLAIGVVVLVGHRWYIRVERKVAEASNKAPMETK
jgi:hypothetical protein